MKTALGDVVSKTFLAGGNVIIAVFLHCVPVGEIIPKKPVIELKKFIQERFNKKDAGDERQELMSQAHLINHQGSEQLFQEAFR